MKVLVTGSLGLVGSEAVKFYKDHVVVGIDNNTRAELFGTPGVPIHKDAHYEHHSIDITDYESLKQVFSNHVFDLIIHTAGQPSHDLAASIPLKDFSINAGGTLNLLELTKQYSPLAVFINCSTNKVYGDYPNILLYEETESRFNPVNLDLLWYGFDERTPIDNSTHSLFGCSKLYGDIVTQEYGRYYGMATGTFRAGCLTGPTHQGAKLHGFLNYLVRCAVDEQPYEIIGFDGKQVRDNIHAADLMAAFHEFYLNPSPGAVYNMGGGIHSNCSVLEAIEITEQVTGKSIDVSFKDEPRIGDHKWWVSNTDKFRRDYPKWKQTYGIRDIIKDIHQNLVTWHHKEENYLI